MDDVDVQVGFGERLQTFLIEQEAARRTVAASVDFSGARLGQWTRGDVPYSIVVLFKLRRKYGVDLNKLICGDSVE